MPVGEASENLEIVASFVQRRDPRRFVRDVFHRSPAVTGGGGGGGGDDAPAAGLGFGLAFVAQVRAQRLRAAPQHLT